MLPIQRVDEDERIDAHLRRAAGIAARRDVSGLPAGRRRERGRLLRELDRYRRAHAFPRNRDFPGIEVPYFVDAEGTRCAVAHLLHVSGGAKLVDDVRRASNHARVASLVPDLAEFLAEAGLAWQEAARIQPMYSETVEAPAAAWMCQTPENRTPAAAFVGRVVERRYEMLSNEARRREWRRSGIPESQLPGDTPVRIARIAIEDVHGDGPLLAVTELDAVDCWSKADRVYGLVYTKPHERADAGTSLTSFRGEVASLPEEVVWRDGVSIAVGDYLALRTSPDCVRRSIERFPALGRMAPRDVATDQIGWRRHRQIRPGIEPLPDRFLPTIELRIVGWQPEADAGVQNLKAPESNAQAASETTLVADAGTPSVDVDVDVVPSPGRTNVPRGIVGAAAVLLAVPLGWLVARRRRPR
jgi:hypothetical protein